MIFIDKKVSKAILKLSKKDYSCQMYHDIDSSEIGVVRKKGDPANVKDLRMEPKELTNSIRRLADKGMISMDDQVYTLTFFINPELKHRFAFLLDEYFNRFVPGAVFGIISTLVTSWLSGIPNPATAVLRLLQLLQR